MGMGKLPRVHGGDRTPRYGAQHRIPGAALGAAFLRDRRRGGAARRDRRGDGADGGYFPRGDGGGGVRLLAQPRAAAYRLPGTTTGQPDGEPRGTRRAMPRDARIES